MQLWWMPTDAEEDGRQSHSKMHFPLGLSAWAQPTQQRQLEKKCLIVDRLGGHFGGYFGV